MSDSHPVIASGRSNPNKEMPVRRTIVQVQIGRNQIA